jgi:uncharacterized protein YndB with AHSA1/START domain
MKFNVDLTVEKPITEVFDKLADSRDEVKWNSQVTKCELKTPEPIRQGSVFEQVNRRNEFTATITTYDKPNVLVYTVSGKQLDIVGTMNFTSVSANSTRLQGDFDFQPKGFMKLMAPLFAPAIRKDFPKQFNNFKNFCEQGA